MIQFYAPDIEKEPFLPEGESLHCSRVLRMKEGDEIIVTDGRGSRFICEIEKSHISKTKLRVKERVSIPSNRNYFLTLAVAPTKNSDRMEWMVEKAVEIGVDKIVFLKCERSERKIIRGDRILKVMIAAMKQSLDLRLPELEELESFNDFVKKHSTYSQKFFGYCAPDVPRLEFVKECKAEGEIVVMIGPEGDFTSHEVETAMEKGFIPITFGEKRLRTETAGVFAVCAVNVIYQICS